jgi:glycosyltransferase involved in cell wall biosynthesis
MRRLSAAAAESLAWLPGERHDVPELMRAFDVFALPSLGEGISNTVLEAMASGLPVVATQVGGNPELVEEGKTGTLVPPGDARALAAAARAYAEDPARASAHGAAGRRQAEAKFSIASMVAAYLGVYDAVLARNAREHGRSGRAADAAGAPSSASIGHRE